MSKEYSNTIQFFILPSFASNKNFPFLQLLEFLSDVQNYKSSLLIDLDHSPDLKSSKSKVEKIEFNTYLLYAVLRLDSMFLDHLNDIKILGQYVNIIASMVSNINKIPRNSVTESIPFVSYLIYLDKQLATISYYYFVF